MEKEREYLNWLIENNAPYSVILAQSQVLDKYIVQAIKGA